MKTLVWHGCYDEAWKGVIPDAAFEHPAKFSKRLVERIIEHMEKRGWLVKEEHPIIADPFAGVRLGGVIAAYRGYQWVGVELEQRFIDLGDSVATMHRDRWARLGVPAPICVKGDSRRFDELIREAADAVVSSPPYISGGHHTDVFDAWNNNGGGPNREVAAYGKTDGQIGQLKEGTAGAVVTSPVYSGNDKSDYSKQERRKPKDKRTFGGSETYGKSAGQIGALKTGKVDAVVASPPFLRAHGGERGIMVDGLHTTDGRVHKGFKERQYRDGERDAANIEATGHGKVGAVISSPPYDDIAAGAGGLNSKPPTRAGQQAGRRKGPSQGGDQRYGKTEGQILRARKGSVGAVISSPPYEDSLRTKEHGFDFTKAEPDYPGRVEHPERVAQHSKAHDNRRYGDEPGQIGKLKGKESCFVCRKCLTSSTWHDVAIVEFQSLSEVAGVSDAIVTISVGRESRKAKNTKQNSQPHISTYPTPNITPNEISTGTVAQVDGAGTRGESKDEKLLPGTEVNASTAEQTIISSSTTLKSDTKQAVSGITVSEIFKRYAEVVTHGNTLDGQLETLPLCAKCAAKTTSPKSTVAALVLRVAKRLLTQLNTIAGSKSKKPPESYWQAMNLVYRATFRALKPGGVMAIVVKDFVKDGRRQRLCDDTLKLLQHIGFEGLERVRAMLVKHYDHGDLFTGTSRTTKTRKSFFRRHLEKDLSPRSHRRINWEEVLFVRKPV